MEKKVIVISAVNFSEGGPLTILSSLLNWLDISDFSKNYEVYALVHSTKLFKNFNNIELIEYSEVKSSWIRRILFEYKKCKKLSKDLNVYFWFSLHDMTPNTTARIKAVYCHNAIAFHKQNFFDFFKNPIRFLYAKFYKYLYRINIHKNDFIVVQPQWMRNKFANLFKISKKKIVVSLPISQEDKRIFNEFEDKSDELKKFFYPAFPRDFKNFEIVCEAVEQLIKEQNYKFEVILTLDGSENNYSKTIFEKFEHLKNIKFIGLQSREKIEEYYQLSDCLIFASKLETWGLPITEYKKYGKPILVSDLPYAHETVGDYKKVKYFDPKDSNALAKEMKNFIFGNLIFDNRVAIVYSKPITRNWEELFKLILNE